MDFYQRLGTLTIVLLLLILFIGSGIADTDPSFDINETIEHEMSFEHAMTLDGFYDNGEIIYAASKWAVIDVDGEGREQQVLEEEEWKIATENGWEQWVEGQTAEDALARGTPVGEEDAGPNVQTLQVSRTQNVDYQFDEPGRYAFTMTLAKMEGVDDNLTGDWEYNITEVETDKYVFAVQEDGLVNIVLE